MSRFDVLKQNAFSNDKKEKESSRRRYPSRPDNASSRSTRYGVTPGSERRNTPRCAGAAMNDLDEFPSLCATVGAARGMGHQEMVKTSEPIETVKHDALNNTPWATSSNVDLDASCNVVSSHENDEKNDEKNDRVGSRWTGYMMIRQRPYDRATATADGVVPLHPPNRHRYEYSRDGKTWYDGWEDTFSKSQLEQMRIEEENEYQKRCAGILEEYREYNIKKSVQHLNVYGELDGYALAELDRLAYEEYEKQFEYTDDDVVDDDYDDGEQFSDYLDDDY